jgi:ubiquinone/menaquinone biosynthesis C-methylase UbiE
MNRSEEWKNFWDEMSAKAGSDFNYNRGTSSRGKEIENLSDEEVADFIDAKGQEVILDAGCGTGTNIMLLHSKVKRIIGIDYARGAIQRCQRWINAEKIQNVEVREASITKVPLPDCFVDKVICMSVLQYIDDRELNTALSEFRRVLRNHGVLVLHVKNLSSLYLSTLWAVKKIKLLLGGNTNVEYFRSFRWYVKRLRSLGFEIADYSSLNLLVLDGMPRRLLLLMQKFELRNHNRGLFKIGFIRRRGSDLKIKARLQKVA